MEFKDIIYAIGIFVTLGLGVWNLIQGHKATRRASFINTVTSQRILWLEQLRQDVSKFVGLTHSWTRISNKDEARKVEFLKEIDQLRYLIRMRLNPSDQLDIDISTLVQAIPDLTCDSDRVELFKALDNLTIKTQTMLKAEWDKVKTESKDGDLHEK